MFTKEPGPRAALPAAFFIAGVLVLAGMFARVASRPDFFQWDFDVYYYAARGFLAGQNFYDLATLRTLMAANHCTPVFKHLGFVYPPITILWFVPFAMLGLAAAFGAYLALKAVVVVAFVALGRRLVTGRWTRAAFPLLTALMLDGALWRDLSAGNVALFEAVWLLLAFSALERARSGRFGAALAAATACKGTLAPLLAVPAFAGPRAFARALAGFAWLPLSALVFALLFPAVSRHYAEVSPGLAVTLLLADRGRLNSSSFQFFAELSRLCVGEVRPALIAAPIAVWDVYVAAATWRTLRRRELSAPMSAALAVLAYVLLMPRMKDYTYVIAIVPCLWAIERSALGRRARVALLVYAMLPYDLILGLIPAVANPFVPSFARLPFDFSPLVVCAICWALLTRAPRAAATDTRGDAGPP
ncbi:MAG TPA: glycosyltransferase family 87 protein [Polyangia bacterium]|jgi:hypothetical protein